MKKINFTLDEDPSRAGQKSELLGRKESFIGNRAGQFPGARVERKLSQSLPLTRRV
jgi:hypothetical protein